MANVPENFAQTAMRLQEFSSFFSLMATALKPVFVAVSNDDIETDLDSPKLVNVKDTGQLEVYSEGSYFLFEAKETAREHAGKVLAALTAKGFKVKKSKGNRSEEIVKAEKTQPSGMVTYVDIQVEPPLVKGETKFTLHVFFDVK